MDLEEWELLPEAGFIDVREDNPRRNPVFPTRKTFSLQPSSVIDMNYFHKFIEQPQKRSTSSVERNPEAITSPPASDHSPKQVIKVPIQVSPLLPSEDTKVPPKIGSLDGSEHGAIPHVPSAKVEENKFADMKAGREGVLGLDDKDEERISQVYFNKLMEKSGDFESPEFKNKGFAPQMGTGTVTVTVTDRFDEKAGDFDGDAAFKEAIGGEVKRSPDGKEEEEVVVVAASDESHGCLNMLRKWGIGAICSFGFAAATVCIIVLSSGQKEKHQQQNPKLHFQMYTDDKRINQAMHHPSKLYRGTSTTFARAHITVGGYLEGL